MRCGRHRIVAVISVLFVAVLYSVYTICGDGSIIIAVLRMNCGVHCIVWGNRGIAVAILRGELPIRNWNTTIVPNIAALQLPKVLTTAMVTRR
jgi:Na+(H+)/acetate symporter ActP